MPPPHNYNTRQNQPTIVAEAVAPLGEEEEETTIMATGFRLEKFRGDGTDDVEDFIKKFERYVNVTSTKAEQQMDLLCLHLEGRASWYIDNLNPAPKDLNELKNFLKNKFKTETIIKMDIFKLKKLPTETNSDFIHRVDKETIKLTLPEQLRVQIAVDGLEPSVRSAISSHGPKTLDEVRVLADRVQASASVSVTQPREDPAMQQILTLLQSLVTQKQGNSHPVESRQQQSKSPMQQQLRPQSRPTGPTARPIRGRQPGSCWRCGDNLWNWLNIMTWIFICLTMVPAVSADPPYFHRLSYGIVFQAETELLLAQEDWVHTFEISLPSEIDIYPITGCNHDKDTCLIINQVLSQINEIRMQTKIRLNNTMETIFQLIPERNHLPKSRGKRALFGFIGELSRSLFNTATLDDVNLLVRHINALKKNTKNVMSSIQQHEEHVSSFIKTSDERMSNLKDGIQQNHIAITHIHTQLQGSFKTIEQSIISMNHLVTKQIQESQKLHTMLNEIESGFYDLVEGKLSPFLLPESIMHHTINEIQELLHNKYPGFYLTLKSPSDIYKSSRFVFARQDSKVYITVKFPMSPHSKPLSLFKVLSFPVPVNATSDHATQILDLPEYFALTGDHQFYTTFQGSELLTCTREKRLSCRFNKILAPQTHETCIMALFANDKALVHKHCDFRFHLNHLSPQIVELSKSTILVYQSELLELNCKKDRKMIKGCNFCVLSIPCECGVSTPRMYLPPRLASCRNHSDSVTKLHPVNLALLQQFFNSTDLSNITGDSMYTILPDVDVPNFKMYNHSMSAILADDKARHLSLTKMAMKAKKDAVIFQSLAEPLLYGEIGLDEDWFSTENFMLYGTMATTAISIVGLIFMFLKLRKALIMIHVLQTSINGAKASVIPSFRYKPQVSTTQPSNLFANLEISWDHGIFTVSLLTLITVLLVVLCKLIKQKTKRTTLLLELSCGDTCVIVPIKSLPLCPSHWGVNLPDNIDNIEVHGKLFPKAYFTWSDFKLTNKNSEKEIKVGKTLSLSWVNAVKMRKLIKKIYTVHFYWEHNGWLEPIAV